MFSPLFARALRFSVFALLLTSLVVATVLSERMWRMWRPGQLPYWAPFAAPACFLLLLLVFALDRLVAVKRGQEAAPRAILQVGGAVFLLSLLLPQEVLQVRRALRQRRAIPLASEARTDPGPVPTGVLLSHSDDRVRRATCLLIAWSAWQPPSGRSDDDDDTAEGSDSQSAEEEEALTVLFAQVSAVAERDPDAEVRSTCQLAKQRLQAELAGDDDACGPSDVAGGEDGTEYL